MIVPAHSPITMPFGATSDPYTPTNPHKGTDFSYIPDNTIYAPFSGRVTLVPNNGNDGNGIYMTDPDRRLHGMLHSSQYLVANGAIVTEGQRIAIMGDTGYAFGVHLHWCVKEGSVFIDPMSLIKKEDDMPNEGDVDNAYLQANGRKATDDEKKIYTSKPWSAPDGLYYGKVRVDFDNLKNTDPAKKLEQIKEIVS